MLPDITAARHRPVGVCPMAHGAEGLDVLLPVRHRMFHGLHGPLSNHAAHEVVIRDNLAVVALACDLPDPIADLARLHAHRWLRSPLSASTRLAGSCGILSAFAARKIRSTRRKGATTLTAAQSGQRQHGQTTKKASTAGRTIGAVTA